MINLSELNYKRSFKWNFLAENYWYIEHLLMEQQWKRRQHMIIHKILLREKNKRIFKLTLWRLKLKSSIIDSVDVQEHQTKTKSRRDAVYCVILKLTPLAIMLNQSTQQVKNKFQTTTIKQKSSCGSIFNFLPLFCLIWHWLKFLFCQEQNCELFLERRR